MFTTSTRVESDSAVVTAPELALMYILRPPISIAAAVIPTSETEPLKFGTTQLVLAAPDMAQTGLHVVPE